MRNHYVVTKEGKGFAIWDRCNRFFADIYPNSFTGKNAEAAAEKVAGELNEIEEGCDKWGLYWETVASTVDQDEVRYSLYAGRLSGTLIGSLYPLETRFTAHPERGAIRWAWREPGQHPQYTAMDGTLPQAKRDIEGLTIRFFDAEEAKRAG